MSDFDFIMDEDLEEIQALTGLNPETAIADFRLFCKYAEIPISVESWDYYLIETRDQA
jgi:hypothetical protein